MSKKAAFTVLSLVIMGIIMLSLILKLTMVVQGVFIALFMLFSVGAGYIFFPRWMKKCIMWGPIGWITDLVLSWGLTYGLGYTVTGFTAGIVFGLLLTVVIEFERLRLFPRH